MSLLSSLSLASTFTHVLFLLWPLSPDLDEAGWWCTMSMWECIFVTGLFPIKSHPRNECKQTECWFLSFTTGNKSRRTLKSSLRLTTQLRARSSLPLTRPCTLSSSWALPHSPRCRQHFLLQLKQKDTQKVLEYSCISDREINKETPQFLPYHEITGKFEGFLWSGTIKYYEKERAGMSEVLGDK